MAALLVIHFLLIRAGILKLYVSEWGYWPFYAASCVIAAVLITLAMRLLRRPQEGQKNSGFRKA
ncbi:hypothetical protein D3C75_553220 [compost metagenome]